MSIQSQVRNPLAASRQAARVTLNRYRRPHVAGVGAVTIVIAAIYTLLSLTLYRTFKDSNYDLVIFDQAIRSYAHFHLGIAPIKGMHDGNGANFSELGDHFSPILAVLAPLYWIYDNPQTLLVAQAVLFALAIPPLWIFTRRAFGGSGWKATTSAYLICIAYGLSWPLVNAARFDFHEVAFAPVLTMIALERLQAGRLRSALIAMAVLLLVKEDMGLLVAGIGAYLAVSFPAKVRSQRLVGCALMVVGVAYTAFASYVLIPAFGGYGDYYWAYSTLGNNVPHAAEHILRHPISTARMLFHPKVKLRTLKWLFGAFCFLPLLSPMVLVAVPLILERLLNSEYHHWWVVIYQYNAFLVIPLVCAAVDGAARLDRWVVAGWRALLPGPKALANRAPSPATQTPAPAAPALALAGDGPADAEPGTAAGDQLAGGVHAGPAAARGNAAPTVPADWASGLLPRGVVALICSSLIFLVALYIIPVNNMNAMLNPVFYRLTPQEQAAKAADATVPSGVVVEAANDLGPELSARDTVLMWDGDGRTPPYAAPWVVADTSHLEFTFHSKAEQRASVANLLHHGYKVVFSRDGYEVLHRPGRADLNEKKSGAHPVETG